MEKAVKELTAWVSSGPNWPYALVWLNEDTHHAPLPKERHLGMLPTGITNSTTFRRISQLEVHQLLISGPQVAYPVGLNGHLSASLPKSLANGTSLTGGGSIYLEVDIPQPIAEEPDQKVSPLGRHFLSNSQPPQDHSPKTGKGGQHDHGVKESPVSCDVRHTWFCVRELDLKKTKPCGCTHTCTPQAERSSQAGGHIITGEHPR